MSGIKVTPSIFVALIKKDKVLLIRRQNTGWCDGFYDLPAGHLEDQEKLKQAAARELLEETGVTAKPKDLKLIHLHQNHHRPDNPHYGYIFKAAKWAGEPKLTEPEKSDDIGFFDLKNLPDKITPYVKEALENLDSGEVTISYHEPDSIEQ